MEIAQARTRITAMDTDVSSMSDENIQKMVAKRAALSWGGSEASSG
jgi:hypothetical protein